MHKYNLRRLYILQNKGEVNIYINSLLTDVPISTSMEYDYQKNS